MEQRREAFMVENPDKFVQFREARANKPGQSAIQQYEEMLLLAVARYSRGDELEEVRKQLAAAVAILEADEEKAAFQLRLPEHYYPAIWGLSLSMLFGDASLQFLHRGQGQDQLFDHLLKLTGALIAPVDQLLHPRPFGPLVQVLNDKAEASAALPAYLRNWYDAFGLTPWHDTHLRQDAAFFGYWCFELAALVKALDITDKAFVDNIFYPRDLVHQRIYRTWLEGSQGAEDRQAKSLLNAPEAVDALRKMIQDVFAGKPISEVDANEKMAIVTSSLGLSEEQIASNPEQFRQVMQQLMATISKVADDALAASKHPESEKALKMKASLQELEAKMLKDSEEMRLLKEELEKEVNFSDEDIAQQKARLEQVSKASKQLDAQANASMKAFFGGVADFMDKVSVLLGHDLQPKRDIGKEVGEELSQRLDEANKKNMIQSDFDWSSIWRKDE